MSFVVAHLASFRKNCNYLREVVVSYKVSLGDVDIAFRVHDLKAVLQVDRLISLVIDLEHGDALYSNGHDRHDKFLLVEVKRRVFSLPLEPDLGLLMVLSLLLVEDEKWYFMAVEALLKRIEAYVYRYGFFRLKLAFLLLYLEAKFGRDGFLLVAEERH